MACHQLIAERPRPRCAGAQFWGIRKVELLVGVLFTCIIAAYFMEITLISPTASEVADGLLPRLWHRNSKYSYGVWLELLCANLGAAASAPAGGSPIGALGIAASRVGRSAGCDIGGVH